MILLNPGEGRQISGPHTMGAPTNLVTCVCQRNLSKQLITLLLQVKCAEKPCHTIILTKGASGTGNLLYSCTERKFKQVPR
jgi:hypothetical protein